VSREGVKEKKRKSVCVCLWVCDIVKRHLKKGTAEREKKKVSHI